MTDSLALRWGSREIVERFLFIPGESYVAGEPKHLEKLNSLVVDVGEHNQSAALFRDVDDPEEDRDADTINQLGVAEVYDQRAATRIKLLLTFALDPFAR